MKGHRRDYTVAGLLLLFTSALLWGTYFNGGVEPVTQAVATQSCPARPELARTVQEFSPTGSARDMEGASRRLLNSARVSAKCRGQVIETIVQAMNEPQLDVYRDFDLWRYGSYILGELKATEGLDLLVKHLSFTDGASINITHYPAMEGVIKIGQPAIPKLGAALRQNSDVPYRFNAVFCIARIGGPRGVQELRTSLSSESDPCVRKFIQVSIDALNNSRTPGEITLEDRDKWFAALSCKQ